MTARLILISLLITSALVAFGLYVFNDVGNVPPHSDGGSHYVTGLLAFDWIHLGRFTNPISFGTEYFKHLPYIGLLLWPPFFYVLEMIAFSVFGPTIQVSLVLVTCIFVAAGALVGHAVWRSGRSLFVAHSAIAATLASVLVQDVQRNILVDGLVAFLSFATALAFSSYLLQPSMRRALGISVLAILAFYSKGNAMQLALILPLTAILMHRYRELVLRRTLVLVAVCVAFTGPYLYVTAGLSGQGALFTPGIDSFLKISKANSVTLFEALYLLAPFFIIGTASVIYKFIKAKSTIDRPDAFESASLATVIGSVGFHALLAVSDDARYMLTALFGIVGVAIVGIEVVARAIASWAGIQKTKAFASFAVVAILLAQFALGIFSPISPMPTGAYEIAQAAIKALPEENRSVMISGDHNIETSIGPVLAQLEGKRRFEKDGIVVVRASRALVGGGYRNRDFALKFNNDEEYRNELRRLGVPIVITGVPAATDSWPHIAAIERVVKGTGSDYIKIAEVLFFQGQVVTVWQLKPGLVKAINFENTAVSNKLRERVSQVTAVEN